MGNVVARRDASSGAAYTPVLPPALAGAPPEQLATFGAGCFWGTEKYFRSFAKAAPPGAIADMAVGFMGDAEAVPNPSYEAVCTGRTGHVEVLQLRFDPERVPYEALVDHFLTFHDPTTPGRQGNDVGPQYASAVFAHTDAQRDAAARRLAALQALLDSGAPLPGGPGFAGRRVASAVRPAGVFYPAEAYHQRYLEANPRGYCNHGVRFAWPPGSRASGSCPS
jgi:peptide-methionine (S)-S-oxide reductase